MYEWKWWNLLQDLEIQIKDIEDDLCGELEDFLNEKQIKYAIKVLNQRYEETDDPDGYDMWKDWQLTENER